MSYSEQELHQALINLSTLMTTITDIVKVGKVQDAKIYIDSLEDKKRKILAADTYFTMLLK